MLAESVSLPVNRCGQLKTGKVTDHPHTLHIMLLQVLKAN